MNDTIAAIATGGTISAIGIVRISGNSAIFAADKIFRATINTRLAEMPNRKMIYGKLLGSDGDLIDMCLCVISRGPDTYTGEDTVEFHCHGSPIVLSETMRSLFSHGVRQAEAGEFTKHAFLNGRMDLTQAEAVIDLIEAETPSAAKNAAGQLGGAIRQKLESQYSQLLDIIAHFHAAIDYPDEDIDDFDMQSYLPTLNNAKNELAQMLASCERGRVLRDGIPTAIIGRPNTGKSSLLNLLLGYDRAIVTDIPGTTRDTVEEKVSVGGSLLRLIDTAGLRETNDVIESIGVNRTHDAIARADLVVIVLDGSEVLQEEDYSVLRSVSDKTRKIIVVNKSDLQHALSDKDIGAFGLKFCRMSALTGDGLSDFEHTITDVFPMSEVSPNGDIITNMRQEDAINRAAESIRIAIIAIESSLTPDAVLTDIELALEAIGETTGKVMRDDIVTRIFERFCVGK